MPRFSLHAVLLTRPSHFDLQPDIINTDIPLNPRRGSNWIIQLAPIDEDSAVTMA